MRTSRTRRGWKPPSSPSGASVRTQTLAQTRAPGLPLDSSKGETQVTPRQRRFARRDSVRTTAATEATMTAAPANVVARDRFVEDRPAERDRHDWVDVGVGRDPRDRRVLQQPGVGGEREPGPEDDEVGEGDQRSGAELGGVEVAELAGQRACQDADPASEEHLPAARDERIARERRGASTRPTAGPHRRGARRRSAAPAAAPRRSACRAGAGSPCRRSRSARRRR